MTPNRWSAQTLHRSGLILGVLSLCAFLGLGLWFWQANAAQERTSDARAARLRVVELGGKDLSTALDKQRAQFLACAQAAPGTPGCYAPVAPPAKEVAPQIASSIGPRGYPGPGPSDAQVAAAVGIYLAANPAPAGKSGVAGKDGTSPDPVVVASQIRDAVAVYLSNNPPADGANATDAQVANAVAAFCDANSQCRGPSGADGKAGAVGTSAYPFTFTFTTTGGRDYTCTLTAAGEPGTCAEALPAPTPTPTATP